MLINKVKIKTRRTKSGKSENYLITNGHELLRELLEGEVFEPDFRYRVQAP